jgi:hypothetical protein
MTHARVPPPPCTKVNTTSSGSYYITPITPTTVTYTTTNQAAGGISACNMGLTYEGVNPITLNVLQCAPNFIDTHPSTGAPLPYILRVSPHPSPSPLQIYLPGTPHVLAGAATALDAAISDWNTRVGAASGVFLTRVSSPCGSGSDCITVRELNIGNYCGTFEGAWDNNGYFNADMFLNLSPSWQSYSSTGLQRTFVHELGHALGLDNNQSCTVNQAAMNDTFDCLGTVSTVTSTFNDYRPVNNTVYGGKPKTSCGF